MNLHYPKLIVFDCDGTLVDSQHMILAAMQVACKKNNLPEPEAEAVRRVVGLSLFYAVKSMMPDYEDVFIEKIVVDYRDAFTDLRMQKIEEPLYPNAKETLIQLQEKGYLLGIATGKSARGLRNSLKNHNIEKYFITLQSADGNASKPHPEMLGKAMLEAGTEPHETMMVGDTSFDILMSKNAGVKGLGVAWGYHPAEELVEAGAFHVLNDYNEMIPLLDKMQDE